MFAHTILLVYVHVFVPYFRKSSSPSLTLFHLLYPFNYCLYLLIHLTIQALSIGVMTAYDPQVYLVTAPFSSFMLMHYICELYC